MIPLLLSLNFPFCFFYKAWSVSPVDRLCNSKKQHNHNGADNNTHKDTTDNPINYIDYIGADNKQELN